jgi:hypothetical protein
MVLLNVQLTVKEFLKSISIIHMSLISGLLLFGLTAFLIKGKNQINEESRNDAFTYVVPLLAISVFLASNLIFKQQPGKLSDKNSLKEKIKGYQEAIIIRFASLEGPALFGTAAYIVNRTPLFLLVSGPITLYFMSLRPTKAKIEKDLNLSYDH